MTTTPPTATRPPGWPPEAPWPPLWGLDWPLIEPFDLWGGHESDETGIGGRGPVTVTEGLDGQATIACEVITGLVYGVIRGRGFPPPGQPPPPDLRAVALAAGLRLVHNLRQAQGRTVTQSGGDPPGSRTVALQGGFTGFTATEQLVLNRWRRRTL